MEKYMKAILASAIAVIAAFTAVTLCTGDGDSDAYGEYVVAVIENGDGTESEYYSLQAAVDAAHSGQTVRLIKDTVEDVTISWTGMTDTILDLNGKSVTGTMKVYGTVRITDGSISTVNSYSESDLLMDGVTLRGFYLKDGAVATLVDVICAFIQNGVSARSSDLTIISGEYTLVQNYSKLTIYGGNFKNSDIVLSNGSSSVATVFGGSFVTTMDTLVVAVGDGATFNMFGGFFERGRQGTSHTGSGSVFIKSVSGTVNVHGGYLYSANYYTSDSRVEHMISSITHELKFAGTTGLYCIVMNPDCEECKKHNPVFLTFNEYTEKDLPGLSISARNVIVVVTKVDLHDIAPSVFGEDTYLYNICKIPTGAGLYGIDCTDGYTELSTNDYFRQFIGPKIVEPEPEPDTPGSGSVSDDDDAGDLPPNVGPSASNSASGSSDSRTISIIAAAVVVIAMGVGALFVFRDH